MVIPLEDNFNDVIGKAMRGLNFSDGFVAEHTGIAALEIQRLREGEFNEIAARKIAPLLGLNADALVGIGTKSFHPEPITLEGLAQFNTPFDDMRVNAYLVWDPETKQAAAFDTGSDCGPMLEFMEANGLRLMWIALTHTHGDHIFDLDRLKEATGAPAFVSALEPLEGAKPFSERPSLQLGKLMIKTLETPGHSKGGLTFTIHGLSRPVAIVGDALFAGSMGGGGYSYTEALRNNREKIMTLDEATVICPGHGPLTSVAEEKKHNPFYME